MGLPQRKVVFQSSIFRCDVSLREGRSHRKFERNEWIINHYFSLRAVYQLTNHKTFTPWIFTSKKWGVASPFWGRHCEANLGRVAQAHEHSRGTFGWRDAFRVGEGSSCCGRCLGSSKGHMLGGFAKTMQQGVHDRFFFNEGNTCLTFISLHYPLVFQCLGRTQGIY